MVAAGNHAVRADHYVLADVHLRVAVNHRKRVDLRKLPDCYRIADCLNDNIILSKTPIDCDIHLVQNDAAILDLDNR